jgi:hypothetical protein
MLFPLSNINAQPCTRLTRGLHTPPSPDLPGSHICRLAAGSQPPLVFLQQRAPAALGRQAAFAGELVAWLRQCRVAGVVVLTGLDAQLRRDRQLDSSPFRWAGWREGAGVARCLGGGGHQNSFRIPLANRANKPEAPAVDGGDGGLGTREPRSVGMSVTPVLQRVCSSAQPGRSKGN